MIMIDTQGRRYALAVAALLSASSGTLGFAGARAQSEHVNTGVTMTVLAVAAILGFGAIFSWGRSFQSRCPRPTQTAAPTPIEPSRLPADLAAAAQDVAAATLSGGGAANFWDPDTLTRLNELHTEGYSDATFQAARAAADALHDSGRGTPENRWTWYQLTGLSTTCAETYLAVLTADLITYDQWDELTRPWRQQKLHPLLPLPVATRYNTPA